MSTRRWLFSISFATLTACSGSTLDLGAPSDAGAKGSSPNADASSDAASAFTCDIDNVTGSFSVTYTKLSGTCPELAEETYPLTPNILWNTPGCTVKEKTTSADRCVSTGSANCVVDSSDEQIEGSITQTSADRLDGTIDIEVKSAQGTCTGKYSIAYRRQK